MSGLELAVLLDENTERRVGEYLRAEGHDVEHVADALGAGAEDARDIAPYARDRDMLILTKDIDFLRMETDEHAGVLFLSNHRHDAYEIAMSVVDVVAAVDSRDALRDVVFLSDWL